jgi:hypothetical protein
MEQLDILRCQVWKSILCPIEQTNDAYPSHSNLAVALLCELLLWAMWSSYGFWDGPLDFSL